MYDIIIKNGTIFDGTGKASFISDIALKDGKIVKIENNITSTSNKIINAENKIVSPGFIDSHGHNDITLGFEHSNSYKLRQGVTTEITGCCGVTIFPYSKMLLDSYGKHIKFLNKDMEKIGMSIDDMSTASKWLEYCESIDVGTNMVMLIGHGAIRASVMGLENRLATDEELLTMKNIVREAMELGIAGLSTGIAYAPGVFTPEEEIIELCKIVAEYNGFYSTHIRNQSKFLIDSIEETLRVVKSTGVKTIISHIKVIGKSNWGQMKKAIELIEDAQKQGLPIYADVYPYIAASTTLKITLPPSVLEGGREKTVERVKQKKWQNYIKDQINKPTEKWENAIGNNGFNNILIINAENSPEAIGKTLQQYSDDLGVDPFEAYFDLIIKNMETGDVFTYNFVMCEEDLKTALTSPYVMVGSDGVIFNNHEMTHPRGVATFTRYLRKYIREENILNLSEAIRKITSLPADVYNLKNKGCIKEGYDADITIFDFEEINDNADFLNCFRLNDGINYVIVNGNIAVDHNIVNNELYGRIIKL